MVSAAIWVAIPARGQICNLAWNDPTSGLFTDVGRWTTSPAAPQDCQNRAPRDGDYIAFRPGAYTVTIPGSYSLVVTEFDTGTVDADITFALGGSLTTRVLATSGQLTVNGSGNLTVTELYNMGPDARFVVDAVTATLGPISASLPGPADLSRRILVRNQGTLVTTAGRVPGTTVDNALWKHQGPPGELADITLLNGGRFQATTLDLSSSRLLAEGSSNFQIDNLKTLTHILIRGGSQMANRTATLSFGDQIVDGTGSKWTINDRLILPASGRVVATNRAELSCEQIDFVDPNRVVAVFATGTDSRVTVRRPLNLAPGNVTANDGGIFTAPGVTVAAGGQVIVQRGPAGLGGAQFNCNGPLTIGSGDTIAGQVSVGGGGRLSAQFIALGFSTNENTLTVDAGNALGSARLDVDREIRVGDSGRGNLRVRNGARLEFTRPDGVVVVTPNSSGSGEISVEGTDSLFDLKSGSIQVGKGGAARLNVTSGGRFQGRILQLGNSTGTNTALALVTGMHSTLLLNQGFAGITNGTLRVVNGGFFQITSDVVEGELSLAGGAVELTGGSANIGNAGGAPTGILRVDRGRLRGSGVIRASSVEVIAQGRCQPGLLSPGNRVLRIEGGSYLQDSNGTLEVDVDGAAIGTNGFMLDVTRGVTLNGNLVVNFLGAAPRAGDQVGLIRFGEGLTGAFTTVTINGLQPGVGFEQRLLSPGRYGLAFTSDGTPTDCTDPAPEIEQIDVSVPGQITATISAGPCGLYRLQYSADLINWYDLQSFAGSVSGTVTVTAQRPSLDPTLFYRVVRW